MGSVRLGYAGWARVGGLRDRRYGDCFPSPCALEEVTFLLQLGGLTFMIDVAGWRH
jgi:hypothetical protein